MVTSEGRMSTAVYGSVIEAKSKLVEIDGVIASREASIFCNLILLFAGQVCLSHFKMQRALTQAGLESVL